MRLSAVAKRILNTILALIGIGAMWAYLTCTNACAYLVGDVLGIDLKFIGIAFMGFMMLATWAKWDTLLRMALAAAIGGEIFLVGYQFYQDVFCPYCLTYALTLILAFIVNYRSPSLHASGWRRFTYILGDVQMSIKGQTRSYPLSLCTVLGFLFFVLAFSGSTSPVYAAESSLPAVYGSGSNEIRIYTDYFCGPCQGMEGDAEKLLDQIIAAKKTRVLFIDTPIHKEVTPLYARYFIYATRQDNTYDRAKIVRKALIAAAKENIVTETALINYLKAKNIAAPLCPVSDYFRNLSSYIKEDRIHSTPSCVIITAKEGKRTYNGPQPILDALTLIAKNQ